MSQRRTVAVPVSTPLQPPAATTSTCPSDSPAAQSAMSTTSPLPSLSVLARNKMHSIFGSGVKDTSSLHRWVLLKNSLVTSLPSLSAKNDQPPPAPVAEVAEEEAQEGTDMFMFPQLDDEERAQDASDESQWLDSLLETLGDDDDEELDPEQTSILTVDDDDSSFLSPTSFTEDLDSHAFHYHLPPIVPYTVPYPPFDFGSAANTAPLPALFDDALPYPFFELEDSLDMPVPDAIEDTSDDDESDAPMTPSSQCSTPTLAMVSIPGLRGEPPLHMGPRIYVDMDGSSPFAEAYSEDPHNRGIHAFEYQEC
jgi:hypothetical protein